VEEERRRRTGEKAGAVEAGARRLLRLLVWEERRKGWRSENRVERTVRRRHTLLLTILLLLVLLLVVPVAGQLREQALIGIGLSNSTDRRLSVRRSVAVIVRRLTLSLLLLLLVGRVLAGLLLIRLLLLGRRRGVVLLLRGLVGKRVVGGVVGRSRIFPYSGRVGRTGVPIKGRIKSQFSLREKATKQVVKERVRTRSRGFQCLDRAQQPIHREEGECRPG
jgi:hypothetical protein